MMKIEEKFDPEIKKIEDEIIENLLKCPQKFFFIL